MEAPADFCRPEGGSLDSLYETCYCATAPKEHVFAQASLKKTSVKAVNKGPTVVVLTLNNLSVS